MGALNERRVTSLVLVLIAAALLSNTYGQQYAELGGAFSPMFFPRIILWMWLLIATLDLVAELVKRRETDKPEVLRVVIIAVSTVIFLWSMTRLGFFLSAVPFTALVLITLNARNPLPLIAVSVGVPMALVALFNHVLVLPLPTSPFAWWF
ncbi:tripartite tricarboxylate transporter TctB family protein [uncultured Roseobacter sp.]|uniref:tripartite tricarboxylate transporter TctB family protein n=1 Tax=uncultured Roseobacter sp. TaxID=114847 RepID=UPI002638EF6F|nr:tripartite tricarboxylate transporter TctB family protein [uncultured Roseobacter sp.]